MSDEEVRNNDNDSKKKWLLLLLLLLLIIFVIFAVVIFLKDDGTAQALDETVSNEIAEPQDSKNTLEDKPKNEDSKNDKGTTTNTVATVKTASKQVVIAAPGVGSSNAAANSSVQKELVKVNIEDDSYFSEPVVLEIAGNQFTATITDSEGNTVTYNGKTTISEDGTYTLTIKETDGKETSVVFIVDTTAPVIEGVEEKLYNTPVTPSVKETNLDKVTLTKNGTNVEYSLGDSIEEDGEYTLEVIDKAGNKASVSFEIDRTAPVCNVEYSITTPTNQDVTVTITASEPIFGYTGWDKAGNDNTITKVFTENAEENLLLKDEAGNETPVTVKVTNIDRVKPTLTVKSESKGTDPYYSKINFKLYDDRLIDKYAVNGKEVDVSNSQWGDANYDVLSSLVKEGENTIVLYDAAGNTTEYKFIIDWTAPILTVKSESKGTDPYYSKINFKLYDDRLIDKYAVNGKEVDVSNSQWGDANYDVLSSLVKEGENTIVLYDVAGNTTEYKFIIDWTAPVLTVKSESKGKDPSYREIHFKLNDDRLIDKYVVNGKEVDVSNSQWGDANYDVLSSLVKEGENTIVLYDVAGNTTEYKFKMDWTAPTYTITYNPEGLTNGNVKVTITASEPLYGHPGWTKGKAYVISKTFAENGEETVVLKDRAGNETPVTIKVTNIDRVPAVIKVQNAVGTDPYFSKVDFAFSDDRLLDKYIINGKEVDFTDNKYSNANYINMKSYLVEGENTIKLYDKAGNETVKTFIIDWTAPAYTVSYDPDGLTNGNVKVTITASEPVGDCTGWDKDQNDSIITKTFTENGEETVVLKDRAGNETSVTVKVTNIDRVPGVITIQNAIGRDPNYSKLDFAFSDDRLLDKYIINGKEVDFTDNKYSNANYINIKSYLVEGENTIKLYDKAGNETVKTFTMDWTAPTYTVTYSTTELTNGDVKVTIEASEPLYGHPGWTKGKAYVISKVFTENGEETVVLKDRAGNETPVTVKVTNIDRVPAVIKVQNAVGKDPRYSKLDFAFSDDRLLDKYIINGKEVDFTDNKYSNANYINIKSYLVEGENTIKLYDKAGNETVKTFTMDWTAPTYTVTYSTTELTNGDVKVTIEASEPLYGHPGWTKGKAYVISKTFTSNGEETVILKDKAGNETVKTFIMDWTPAVINVESYIDPNWDMGEILTTNEDVVIVNEPNLPSVNGSLREYKATYSLINPTFISYHYTLIVVRDRAGNETTMIDTDGDGGMFIPVYAAPTLSSVPLKMVKSARPVTSAAPKAITAQDTEPAVTTTETATETTPTTPVVTDTPVVEEPKVEETPVVTDTPVVEEPKVEETPVVTDTPVVEEPKVEETPVVTETPVAEEPKVEETPVVTDTPVVEEPKVEETPIVTETPVVEEPKVEETPIVTETPVVEEPKVEETPVVTEVPVIEETPEVA